MTADDNYFSRSVEEVAGQLSTDIGNGLSEEEVPRRRQEYGYNEFEKTKRTSLWVKFFNQFKSFMIIVLIAAAVISGVVGFLQGEGISDAIIILVIVVLNAVIGVFQEAKAEKSLDALEKLTSPHSKVMRDGQLHVVESRELVPGDIVVLETGDSVPADIRLTEAVNLKIQEAALTGESVPTEKDTLPVEAGAALGDRSDMAYASTLVTYGRGSGIVVGTGMNSEVGKIASMLQAVPDTKTPMQIRLDKLGKILAIAAIVICVVMLVIGVLYGRPLLEMFMTAVALAAAAIPEGLPAVSTITLAIGVQRLVKRNAIVRKLASVETLGSTQVICSDKTGTLTQNRMTVVRVYADGKAEDVAPLNETTISPYSEMLRLSILANDGTLTREEGRWETTGDPTETAMIDLGLKYGMVKNEMEKELRRVAEIPFDSDRKMMTTVHKTEGGFLVAVKGGLDEILSCCDRIEENGKVRPLTDADRKKLQADNISMAQQALRVLATAKNDIDKLPAEISPTALERELVFVGMLGMIDPPREEVKVAVAKCRDAGIKPVMITGDHLVTATAIAEALGIKSPEDRAVTGSELENMSDEELSGQIYDISVYARVSPEHKVRIVKAFQAHDKVVAMTGDGVNDAPALKLADIGVAMGITGTDVSKEAADVVLTDDNFATIVSAVEEGRRIYDNITNAINFLLSTNMGEVFVLFIAVLFNWDSPLLPIHILWINLVTDSLPALALSFDPAAHDIMKRQPIDSRQGIMTKRFTTRMFLQGVVIAAVSLTAYHVGLPYGIDVARSMTFCVLAFSQFMVIFGIRSGSHSAFRGMFNNKYLIGAMATVLLLMVIVVEIPALMSIFHIADLTSTQWLWVGALSFTPLVLMELVKLIAIPFRKKNK